MTGNEQSITTVFLDNKELTTKQSLEEAFKVNTTVKTFDQSTIITRATNTTAYVAGQLVLGNGATTLIPIDLTPDGAVGNQRIQITQFSILSDQNPSTSILIPIVQLFNNALSNLADAQVFTPTFDTLNSYRQALLQSEFSNTVNSGTNGYYVMSADYARSANLDSSGKLYIALLANNAYTPKSGERIKLRVRGYLL